MGYKHLTQEERETIESMIKAGHTGIEITEKTGRSVGTIDKIRKELKLKGFDIWHNGSTIAKSIPVANCDIPKKEVAEKPVTPKKVSSLVATRKTVRFTGKHTSLEYIIGSNVDDLMIRTDTGDEFRIAIKSLEGFVDELIDLSTEIDNIKKFIGN